ncbi:MAG: hypothetical protein ABSB22_05090 [Thermodesulfobacteriota bacterium]|jgi:formylmethanofuran dehydrogenase subunit E
MADISDDLFEKMNGIDPFGPHQWRERKPVQINGVETLVETIHAETEIDGVLHIIDDVRYQCQSCGIEWVTPGLDGSTKNNKVLCKKCAKKARIKAIFKPLWSPFVKFEE